MSRPPAPPPDRISIAAEIVARVAARGPGRSICPSEVARALAEDWRPLMEAVRGEAARLAAEGRIAVTQRGVPVDPATARGPIRLALARPHP